MKNRILTMISGVALIAGLAGSPAALASDSADVTKSLAGSTALELPAKAASLVAKASAADKQIVAAAVVKAAVGVNPSAAVAIVSAVARENPATAPVVAVAAATLQPKRIDQITKAAVAAAPSEAAKIVAALIKEFPQDYGIIAIAAADGSPSSGRAILAVVADYVHALKPSILGATAKFAANDGNIPVQAVLSQSYSQALSSGAAVRTQVPVMLTTATLAPTAATPVPTATTPTVTGPPSLSPTIINAPFTPPPGHVTSIGPGQVTPQGPGGRNYSSP